MNDDLSIVMLGWRAQETTCNTLSTYARARLYDTAGEFFAHFNQFSETDRRVAEKFGIRAIGSPENLGIWGAMDAMADAAKGDYLLFLQDDHPVVVSPEETEKWISGSVDLLRRNRADVVLLSHRFDSGDHAGCGHYFKYFHVRELDPRVDPAERHLPPDYARDTLARRLRRFFRPFAKWRKLGNVMTLELHPEKVVPKYIWREGDFIVNDSFIRPFSETPFMISKRLYRELSAWGKAHPRKDTILGFQILEIVLNVRWWRRHHFRIAFCDTGVFSHLRLDDSWRSNHRAFNPDMALSGQKS